MGAAEKLDFINIMGNRGIEMREHHFNPSVRTPLNDKQIISQLRQQISELEDELYASNSTASKRLYVELVEAAAGNGIEMLTEVALEMADRIADLEVQRDEAILPGWAAARWRPIAEAPELTPLFCYWCAFPESDDEEQRPEFWDVVVRRADCWYMYTPMWEGGCGVPLEGEPDFFQPLNRPAGNPKWRIGEGDELYMQREGE